LIGFPCPLRASTDTYSPRIPYGQSAQAITATPQITGNLLSLATSGPLSSGTVTWQDGVPYQYAFNSPGSSVSGSASADAFGAITSSTVNPGGNSANAITTQYSSLGLPTSISGPLAATISPSFTSSSITQTLTRNSHSQTVAFAPTGDFIGFSGYGAPNQTWSAPSLSGNIASTMTTAVGTTQNFTSSLAGTILQRTFPDGSAESFGYDPTGALTSGTTPRSSFTFAPNTFGQPTQISSLASFGYDSAGRPNSIADASVAETLTYSTVNGALATGSYSGGVLSGEAVTHTYNSLGQLTGVTLPGGLSVGYTYNAGGTLNTITTAAGLTGAYGNYDPVSGRPQNFSIGPLSTTSAFDGLGRNISQSSTAAGLTSSYSRGYDADGHCTSASAPEGNWSYTYDSNGYLHTATGYQNFTYTFDQAGRPTNVGNDFYPTALLSTGTVNVLGSVTPGATVTINGTAASVNTAGVFSKTYAPPTSTWQTYDVIGTLTNGTNIAVAQQVRNVYVPPLSKTLTYDADGNRAVGSRWSLTWNTLDQLTSVVETVPYNTATATEIDYINDSQGRRVQTTYKTCGNVTQRTTTLWDNWRPVLNTDYNPSGTVIARHYYTWGPDVSGSIDGAAGIGGLIEILDQTATTSTVSLPIYDGIGNLTGLVDGATGAREATFIYSPFGQLLASYGARAATCPFGFQTKPYDSATGYYNFGKRIYDPKTGWLTRDPEREEGGVNLYAYCGDDPVGNFDPIGEASLSEIFNLPGNGPSSEVEASFRSVLSSDLIYDLTTYKSFPDEIEAALQHAKSSVADEVHGSALATYYRGQIGRWEVASEADDVRQTELQNSPAYKLREIEIASLDATLEVTGVNVFSRALTHRDLVSGAWDYHPVEATVDLGLMLLPEFGELGTVSTLEYDAGQAGRAAVGGTRMFPDGIFTSVNPKGGTENCIQSHPTAGK